MNALTDARGHTLPDIEAPSPERLRAYGDMIFLAFRSPRHARLPVAQLRTYLEPPLLLGQFRLFRFDGVARGLYTWGWLDRAAERRPLPPADGRAGQGIQAVHQRRKFTGISQIIFQVVIDHALHPVQVRAGGKVLPGSL